MICKCVIDYVCKIRFREQALKLLPGSYWYFIHDKRNTAVWHFIWQKTRSTDTKTCAITLFDWVGRSYFINGNKSIFVVFPHYIARSQTKPRGRLNTKRHRLTDKYIPIIILNLERRPLYWNVATQSNMEIHHACVSLITMGGNVVRSTADVRLTVGPVLT